MRNSIPSANFGADSRYVSRNNMINDFLNMSQTSEGHGDPIFKNIFEQNTQPIINIKPVMTDAEI